MAKSVGSIIIDLGLNSTKFNSGIDQAQRNLGKSMGKMTKDMRAVAQGGKQIDIMKVKFNELSNVVEKQERYMDKSRKQLEKWREEGKQGTVAFKELERKVENGELVLESYNRQLGKTSDEMKLMKASQTGMAKQFDNIGNKLESVGSKMSDIGSSLTKKLTLPLGGAMAYSIKKASEWESAFAGVKKTVDEIEVDGKTTYSYERLGKELQDLTQKLPLTSTELAGIAENAGQLGVATGDVINFTETMAMMAESTNMSSEEASMSIAKMMNIMGTAPEDVSRLASTIVELGNNTATTEKDIMEMAMRIAGTGKLVGLSEEQVLGLSASLSSVGKIMPVY